MAATCPSCQQRLHPWRMTVMHICPECDSGLRYRTFIPLMVCIGAFLLTSALIVRFMSIIVVWQLAALLTGAAIITPLLIISVLGVFGAPVVKALKPGVTYDSARAVQRRLMIFFTLATLVAGAVLLRVGMMRVGPAAQTDPIVFDHDALLVAGGDTLLVVGVFMAALELIDRVLDRGRALRLDAAKSGTAQRPNEGPSREP